MSWSRTVTGWVQLTVSGASPERFLRALAERSVAFWDAPPPENFALTVCVPAGAERMALRLAESLGCQASVRRRRGLLPFLRRLCRRYVLLACLGLTAAVLFVGSAFVWRIDIMGNESMPEGPIRQALQACGVDIGAFWPAFSQDQIRNGVILRLPGIRWMTVTMRGSHALVTIREAREHLPVVQNKELVKIVAAKPALVADVQPLHGTALTEPGQAVLPGETLIGGYTTGRFNVQGPCRAIGPVTGRTWYELTAKSPLAAEEKRPEERQRVQWALILGKTRINFYKGSSICPTGCDKIIESYPLQSSGIFTLPVTLEKTVFTSDDTEQRRQEELREEMEERLMERLLAAIGPEGQVTDSTFTASEEEGALYVTLRAECREQIGVEMPLTEAELAEIQKMIPGKTEEQ